MVAAARAVGAGERRALHARDDGGDERAARAQGRAHGVRRRPTASSTCSTCGGRTARTSTGCARRIPAPLVPLERCHGVRERIGPEGVVAPLEPRLAAGARAGGRGGRRVPAVRVPRRVARACGRRGAAPAAARTRTSSPRTRSRPSSASTSARRRRRSTRISARRSSRLSRAARGGVRAGRAAGAARDALVRRRRDARRGGRASGGRARLRAGRGRGRSGAGRPRWPASRTRSRSTWAARRPTSA